MSDMLVRTVAKLYRDWDVQVLLLRGTWRFKAVHRRHREKVVRVDAATATAMWLLALRDYFWVKAGGR